MQTSNGNQSPRCRWAVVVLYATAMAWVESAVVLYLRTIADRLEPYQADPLPMASGFAVAELLREVATILMLATVGWLAGRNWRTRFGYFVIAFGVWDIFYYVFLKPLTGWPNSLVDWDILFLIPLPWWGPVIAPCAIATLMIVFGTLVTQFHGERGTPWPRWPGFATTALGVLLALYVFMEDAIPIAGKGEKALRELLPTQFAWPLFSVALVLIAVPVAEVWRQIWPRRNHVPPSAGVLTRSGSEEGTELANLRSPNPVELAAGGDTRAPASTLERVESPSQPARTTLACSPEEPA